MNAAAARMMKQPPPWGAKSAKHGRRCTAPDAALPVLVCERESICVRLCVCACVCFCALSSLITHVELMSALSFFPCHFFLFLSSCFYNNDTHIRSC